MDGGEGQAAGHELRGTEAKSVSFFLEE